MQKRDGIIITFSLYQTLKINFSENCHYQDFNELCK